LKEEEVEMMEEDDDDDDIPTILVGGEEVDITDVTPDIIARMTTEEMERYNQVCSVPILLEKRTKEYKKCRL
jgi:hypothetical protein